MEDKFNKCYDTTYIPLLLKSKWLNKIAHVTVGNYPKYLAIYESYLSLLSPDLFFFIVKGTIKNIQAIKKIMLPIKYKVSPLLIPAAIKKQAHTKNKPHPQK